MAISLFTVLVGLVLVYFVWGSIDPDTVQDLESRLSKGSAIDQGTGPRLRTRNVVGVVVTGTMFLAGLYYDIFHKTKAGYAAPESVYKAPTDKATSDRQLRDSLDAAVLQKELERRKDAFGDQGP